MKINTIKHGLMLAMWLCFGMAAYAQPANDDCNAAIGISSGQTVFGTTIGANNDNAPFCGTSNTAPGVWYSIVGNGGNLTASLCGATAYDSKISIYTGSCGSLTCVAGNDDFCGLQSQVLAATNPGTTYLILVHGFSSNTGDFELAVNLSAPPSGNDICAGATAISCGQTVSGTTVGANPDNAPFCGTSNTAPGVWYKLSGTAGIVTASLCNGTNYDSKLTVYSGSCGAFTCVAGNDDACSVQSEVQFTANATQDYFILVHGFGSSSGNFSLNLACIAPPSNDSPCDAVALNPGSNPYAHIALTADANEIGPGAGTGASSCNSSDGWCSFETDVDNSAWFTFVAPASGAVVVGADGFDSQVAVYSVGDCADYSTFVELGGNDDGGDDVSPTITNTLAGGLELNCLTPGETYYLQVDGYNGAETLSANAVFEDQGGTPPSVDFGGCQSRFIGFAPAEADTNFLIANASGVGPFIFEFSVVSGDSTLIFTDQLNDSTGAVAVQPNQTTTYSVTVTDSRGCSATNSVTVNLVDVSCGNNGNKVQVCHHPPGNPNNPQLLCISPNAVSAHLNNHDDHLGDCENGCRATNPSVSPPPACVDLVVTVTTDNFANETDYEVVERSTGVVILSRSFTSADDNSTFSDTICVDPRDCYDARITDSFGDGICCTFGQGTWSVTFDGVTTNSPSNGSFGSSETISVGDCSQKSAASAATNILEMPAMKIAAYPNPAHTEAHIKMTSNLSGKAEVRVLDQFGKRVGMVLSVDVEAGSTHLIDLNTAQLPAGLYFYQVTLGEVSETGKLQVIH